MERSESIERLGERLRSGYRLPPLSPVALRLIEIASDERCSADDLARVLEKDPALTVKLLRLANSPAFRSVYPAATIQQAVVRIGFHQLRILALSLSLKDAFPLKKTPRIDYEEFWRVSLYQALFARNAAASLGTADPHEAFVAGLILEIGLLIFLDLLGGEQDEEHEIALHPLESLLLLEKERYGITHREVGEHALAFWRFPASIVATQRPVEARGFKDTPLARVCVMAQELSSLISSGHMEFVEPFARITSRWRVKEEVLDDAVAFALAEMNRTAEALQIKVDSDRDIADIMEKARLALGRISEQILQSRMRLSGPSDQPLGEGKSVELPTFDLLSTSRDNPVVRKTLEAVAHEIRNPLAAVGCFARRLANTLEPDSHGWRYVEVILEETKRLEQALEEVTRLIKPL